MASGASLIFGNPLALAMVLGIFLPAMIYRARQEEANRKARAEREKQEALEAKQKEAEANVILRREETAATRSMAQTAKVLAENPLLVRLKELEAYKELAAKVGQVHVVLGDGALSKLELKLPSA